jgi:cell wall-associated NlpC family hydrolase
MKKYSMLLCASSLFNCLYSAWWEGYNLETLAVITVPVADMLTKPARLYDSTLSVSRIYAQIPLACEPNGYPCVRVHQALFNEILFNSSIQKTERVGSIPNAHYGINTKSGKPHALFYTPVQNTCSLAALKHKKIDLGLIPAPRALARSPHNRDSSVIVLLMPWLDFVTGLTYSAGTRFVRASSYDTPSAYAVALIDYRYYTSTISFIPKVLCMPERERNAQAQRALFIQIVKNWASLAQGVIPYVLGGSSFIDIYGKDAPFSLDSYAPGKKIWVRPGSSTEPKTGLDCSELIWRAAHIAGIDYRAKNTATLVQSLKPLSSHDTLQEGDILWVPGHVMIVSDLANNEFIEAAGYLRGYGRVHRIALKDRLEGVSTYDELIRRYHERKTLIELNARGSFFKRHDRFMLLKLLPEHEPTCT